MGRTAAILMVLAACALAMGTVTPGSTHGVWPEEPTNINLSRDPVRASTDGWNNSDPRTPLFPRRDAGGHRLRAAGGEAGPELTRVTERMTEQAFRARLVGHPGWLERTPEQGEASAQHVWAFLRAVGTAARDGASADEPPPEETAPDRRRSPRD